MSSKVAKSAAEKALDYIGNASRIKLQDLRDNPGARVKAREVQNCHNQAGHTIGELQHAAKPPFGWVWGNFYRPWQRMFPGERRFNGDINIRREYIPLSMLELQRMIDLGYLDTNKLVDVTVLSNTKLLKISPNLRQFGIHLTDEGSEIFASKINLEVQWASLSAIAAVEKAGGRIQTAYYDLESLKAAVDPERWFRSGQPIPSRKYPPHNLYSYYSDANNRGYLSKEEHVEKSKKRLANILNYELRTPSDADLKHWKDEQKEPTQVFLGLNSGALVSLADRKVFEPTHPEIIDYYRPKNPLADRII